MPLIETRPNLSNFLRVAGSTSVARVYSRDFSLGPKYRLISAVYEINDVTKYMYPFGDAASGDYKVINLCRIELLSDFLKKKIATTTSHQ